MYYYSDINYLEAIDMAAHNRQNNTNNTIYDCFP